MGSSIAWAWWDQYPDAHKRIRNLIVADQAAIMVRDPHWTDEQAAQFSSIFTPGAVYDAANDMAAQLPGLVKSMFTDSISESDYQWILSQNRKVSDANSATLLVDHAFRDWRDVLPKINVPTLVLAGNLSLFPPAGIEWVASQIPGAEHYTFSSEEKGSHFVFWENPVKFNAVVKDFLKRCAQRA
jgi:pimeloyl-ACP methyl ester carboxylesterase